MRVVFLFSALLIVCTLFLTSKAYAILEEEQLREDILDEGIKMDRAISRRLRRRIKRRCLYKARYGEACDSWRDCCSGVCRRGKCWTNKRRKKCKPTYPGPPTLPDPEDDPFPIKPIRIMGRPFRVNGDVVSAPLTCQGNGDKRVEVWKESAVGEHASVASFADLSLKLFALGAPIDLLEKAAAAQLDEVRHANLFLGLIQKASPDAQKLEFEAVNIQKKNSSVFDTTHEQIMLESLEDGCMNEGIAAKLASEVAKVMNETHIKSVYETIATDESRHAMLAWDIVDWVLTIKPELTDTAKSSYDKFEEATKMAGATKFPGAKLTTEEAAAGVISDTLRANRERLSKITKRAAL